MQLKLIRASKEYENEIRTMLDAWYATGEKIIPYAIRRIDYHDFDYYCANLEAKVATQNFVPDSTFFCLDEERNKVVGAVNIRHYLNESLLLDGGHIGDGVLPSERRKGIATEMIRLALLECYKLGIYKVLMVCDTVNIGSAKSIQNNGGELENEVTVSGVPQQRYWIDLKKVNHLDTLPDCIRYMSVDEIPDCVRVIRTAFKTVADEFGFTEENAPRFTAFATEENRLKYQLLEERRPMYVYLVNGQIVGYYSLALLGDGEAELNNLAVLPEFRHQKIGQKILQDCFSRLKDFEVTTLKISIVEENTVVRKWYESFGFIHVNQQKYDFFPFTCGYMEKKLELKNVKKGIDNEK